MLVKEIKRLPHCYTLRNGETFRLSPLETKTAKNELVSEEMIRDSELGEILLLNDVEIIDKPKEEAPQIAEESKEKLKAEVLKEETETAKEDTTKKKKSK